MSNKKGQVGDTAAWFVATIVIVVILSISIYVSSLLSTSKVVNSEIPLFEGRNSNLLIKESLFSFLLTKYNDMKVYDSLVSNTDVDGNVPRLGAEIFNGLDNETKKTFSIKKDGKIVFGGIEQDYKSVERLKLDSNTEIEIYSYEVKSESIL